MPFCCAIIRCACNQQLALSSGSSLAVLQCGVSWAVFAFFPERIVTFVSARFKCCLLQYRHLVMHSWQSDDQPSSNNRRCLLQVHNDCQEQSARTCSLNTRLMWVAVVAAGLDFAISIVVSFIGSGVHDKPSPCRKLCAPDKSQLTCA